MEDVYYYVIYSWLVRLKFFLKSTIIRSEAYCMRTKFTQTIKFDESTNANVITKGVLIE